MHLRRPLLLLGIMLAVVLSLIASARGIGPPPLPYHGAFGHGPTIALVHGLGSRPEHWLPTARLLAREHRVVLVDLPGHGETPMATPLSLDRAADALDAALADASSEPVVLVGHSVGGLVAAAEAIRNPARVRALVLVDTALEPQLSGAARAAMLAAVGDGYDALLRGAYASFARDPAQGEALYREAAALDSTSLKPWIRLVLTADLSGAAAKLRMPTLAVVSERSWEPGETWSHASSALGYTRVPHLEHVRIEGTGHFIMLDQPVRLARAIERFVAHPAGELVAER